MHAINSKKKYAKVAIVAHGPKKTHNLAISHCCVAEEGYMCEMYVDSNASCTATVLDRVVRRLEHRTASANAFFIYPSRHYFLLDNTQFTQFLLSRRHFENSVGSGLDSTILAML